MSNGVSKPSLRRSSSKLDDYRIVHFNTARVAEHKFASNKITTYLYSWWNFAPKILFEEFSKLPYMYFLTMTALQCIPIVSNTSGVPTLAPILTIMVCASAALKLIEVCAIARGPSHSLSRLAARSQCPFALSMWPPHPHCSSPLRRLCPSAPPTSFAPVATMVLLARRTGHATELTKRPTTLRPSASADRPSLILFGRTSRCVSLRRTPRPSRPLVSPVPPLNPPTARALTSLPGGRWGCACRGLSSLGPISLRSHLVRSRCGRWVISSRSQTTRLCQQTS